MAARSYWKGFLQVGQVTCHVAFQTATDDAEQVHLHLTNADNGHALRQQYVDAETGDVVPHDRQGRGYEVSSGVLVTIDEAEVDALRVASTDVLEVTGFVRRRDVDRLYLGQPYHVVPDDPVGEEAFEVLCAAMREADVLAVAAVVVRRHERAFALEARERGVVAWDLLSGSRVRPAPEPPHVPNAVPVTEAMQGLARDLVAARTIDFDPHAVRDRYQEALIALVRDKARGATTGGGGGPPPPPAPPLPAVTAPAGLMDALRRSLRAVRAAARPRRVRKAP